MQQVRSTITLVVRRGAAQAKASKADGDDYPALANERSSLIWSGKDASQQQKRERVIKAAFYAVQVFYSFFIMWVCSSFTCAQQGLTPKRSRLLFMTYNGWIMLAVALGAFIGYLGFGNSTSVKSVACH